MDLLLLYVTAGAAVGFAIGLTGVGGGSLMTPLLLLFGFPPQTAIGTDLLYACITKAGGATMQARRHNVDWRVTGLLVAGSLPAAAITVLSLSLLGKDASNYQSLLTMSLGFMLICTAVVLLFRRQIRAHADSGSHPLIQWLQSNKLPLTFLSGVLLGVLVTLSSVGAGSIGTALLLLLYPAFSAVKIVGSELAHAVPLTLVAGLGHLWLGHVNFELLGLLLVGSLPAIALGTYLGSRLPSKLMHSLLALTLMSLGVKYAFF